VAITHRVGDEQMPTYDSRLGCSTISFSISPARGAGDHRRPRLLRDRPRRSSGVCDHVPYVLDMAAVEDVARTVIASGLRVRSINGDIATSTSAVPGRPCRPRTASRHARRTRRRHDARALVLPCGAIDHTPTETLEVDVARVADELTSAADVAASRDVRLWTESLHLHRLC
jgi:hypothetical protein